MHSFVLRGYFRKKHELATLKTVFLKCVKVNCLKQHAAEFYKAWIVLDIVIRQGHKIHCLVHVRLTYNNKTINFSTKYQQVGNIAKTVNRTD